MRAARRFLRRLFWWISARRDEERLRAEIDDHLARQTADNIRAGMPPAEARRRAEWKFGGVEAMKESYREQRGLPPLETLVQDVRFALRRLRRAPAFTLAAVLTLSLGIGATTSMFTLVHAVLLKSLPVADPARLYRLGRESRCCYLGGYSQDDGFTLVSYELYQYLRDHTSGFSELAAFPSLELQFGVRRAGSPEGAAAYPGEFVSGNYFRMFGVQAYAGRLLAPADDRPGAPPAAVMSHRLWQQKYGADPSVIGAAFLLDDKPFTVVGVAPPGFFGDTLRGTPPDFFLPLNAQPALESDADVRKPDVHWLGLIGRLEPAANVGSVEAGMRVALKQWLRSHWAEMTPTDRTRFPEQTLFLSPGGGGITSMRDQYQRWLAILMTITGFVLLIVCANIANLMLVRGMESRRQTSLSMALGARASRVVRQPLIESLLLSLAGGAAGLAVAFAGTRLILRLAFPAVAGLAGVPISPSPSLPVLLFACAASLATGMAFGIAPAWMALHVDPMEVLRSWSPSSRRAGSLARRTLVVLQAALSLVLLSAAGLLTTAFDSLERQDFGFQQEGRLVAGINPKLAGYRPAQLSLFYRRIRDAVAAVPGVSAVGLCQYAPLSGGGWGTIVTPEGRPDSPPTNDFFSAWDRVTPDFFQVIGNPIVRGRGFSEQDTASAPAVAVVNETFARQFFRGHNPLGKRFHAHTGTEHLFEIVGVAKDARFLTFGLGKPVPPFFFVPEAQSEYSQTNLGSLFLRDMIISIRPGAGPSAAAIGQALASVDPNLPVVSIQPLRERVADQFLQPRLIARLTSFFSLLSLLLAAVGLYGVTAYSAASRTAEVGVRMALGADRGHIIRLVLRGSLRLILVGLSLGLPLALAAGRLLGSQLYGTSPYNPAVSLAAVAALVLSALAASLVPALRASGIAPSHALRQE